MSGSHQRASMAEVGLTELDERSRQYRICAERGHVPSDVVLSSNPPWQVCRHCGTQYRYETKLVEANVPGV